ncbi:xanthine dehydrogenase accessory protein XdhC [Agrobacterium sp. GD03871]|uniref:xanthine dehydrogenase accessory protein XdhC n=1 Tax=unclassified Agrobacterium TaxID=2632611 RepID=UPI0024497329|nr:MULTISPECIES: xanthine dehydrogenase accessory protein XdhC [unclassified Agrobacterium]MDH0615709.1 xanthine dehydrogenase accessory protein XdhC [Agrobacterium sp. GD03872]MDH0697937.1 xanthine dehydrogenase accessory protein XdhC [Agrobacterium sp. GD03871]MDH2211101.1 xanthine dehydrogenase accessory protein XdhC [Agrobacterium sp. GD03643]MDH2221753.1 xanthine dehydrogenase accessory protein XdhC [Agrobacterium sp. GD03638]MDH2226436.1 xanthine dehydrogenase accessory protein XdhC [Agr
MPDTSLSNFLARSPTAILVEIEAVKGSSPREAGTFMLVSQDALWATIGGGQFEYMAMDHARAMLRNGVAEDRMDIPLGPEIGQCCGGRTLIRFQRVTKEIAVALETRLKGEAEQQPAIFIFGAGHVGKALADALSLLPLTLTVVETRENELYGLPQDIASVLTPMPEALVTKIPANGAAIIVTHDHALDFLIAKEALARDNLAYVGMIGSKTKRATFAHWLEREGEPMSRLAKLTLPIGGNSVRDKRPAIIAALVATELLQAFSAAETRRSENRHGHPQGQDHA